MKKNFYLLIIAIVLPLLGFAQPSNFVLLNGTESIIVGNSTDLNTGTLTNRTVEFWFKADDVSHTNREVIYEEGGNVRGINFWVESGSLYLGIYNDADGTDKWYGTWFRTSINSGQWYHVALVLRSGNNSGYPGTLNENLEWYLGGVMQNTGHGGVLHNHPGDIRVSSTETGVFPKTASWWSNGAYEATSSANIQDKRTSLFKGAVGLLRIWNSARTEAQVDANKDLLITTVGTDDLVAYLNGNLVTDTGGDSGSDGIALPNTTPTDCKWLGGTDSNWNIASNWSSGIAPQTGDNIQISTSVNNPVIPVGNSYYYNTLTIDANKTLNLNDVDFDLSGVITVNGNLIINENTIIYARGKDAWNRSVLNGGTIDIAGHILCTEGITSTNTINILPTGKIDVDGFFENSGWFTVKSDATGTGSLITNGTVTGNVTVERYVAYTGYGSISTPVVSNTSVFMGHTLFSHNEANRAGGQPYASLVVDGSVNLNPMEGYVFVLDEANFPIERKFYFTGTPNSGNYNFTLTSTDYTGNGDYYGWNMVGNPYPSSITWAQTENNIANSKVNSTMYLFDGANNRWLFFNPTLPAVNSEIDNIPVGQAFFIQLNSTAGSNTSVVATFTNALRAHNTGNVNFGTATPIAKKSSTNKLEIKYPDNYLELRANVNGKEDKAYYLFRDEATFEFDNKYDSYKLMAWDGGQPNVYFYSGDTKTSIQQEPETNLVNIGFYVSSGDQVEFSLGNVTSFSSLVLEDRKENTFTDLLLTAYTFTNDNDFKDRFVLHLEKQTLSENEEVVEINQIYYSEDELHITLKDKVQFAETNIYDMQGRFILSHSLSNPNKEITIQSSLDKGIYIVKVNTDLGLMSKTIIVN